MPTAAQAKKFTRQVKTRLLIDGKSVTAFARELGWPRNSVSLAINRGCFPRVVADIKTTLNIK